MNATERKILETIYAQKQYWFIGSLARTLDISDRTVRKYVKILAHKDLIVLIKSLGEFKFQGYHTLKDCLGKNRPVTIQTSMTIEYCDERLKAIEKLLEEKV